MGGAITTTMLLPAASIGTFLATSLIKEGHPNLDMGGNLRDLLFTNKGGIFLPPGLFLHQSPGPFLGSLPPLLHIVSIPVLWHLSHCL